MPPASSRTTARPFSTSDAAAAGAGTARHWHPAHGPLRRASIAACTAALHAVTVLCQSCYLLDVIITTLVISGDNNVYRLGSSSGSATATEHEASERAGWHLTLALASLARAITPTANATTAQFAYGCLDLCSLCARLLLPTRWQLFGALTLFAFSPFLFKHLTPASAREIQGQGTQAQPTQPRHTAGRSTADSVPRSTNGMAARRAAHLLFSLCFWVPAARATAALCAFSLRCLNKVWRLGTFRRPHSAGPWPLLPAVLVASALERWAWQSTADSLVLHHRWKEVGQLRERLPPEEAGCWPLLALRRCLQLVVIQESGQPPESVLGAPPLPLPFGLRLLWVVSELAQSESRNDLRARLETVQGRLMANTLELMLWNCFLLSMIIFFDLLRCVAYLMAAIPMLGLDIRERLWGPAHPAAAFSQADAEGAPSRAGSAAAFARAAGTPAPFQFGTHAQPSAQTAAPGGAGSSSLTGRSGYGMPGAPLVFSAAGVGEEGAVQRRLGSRQRYRQPKGHLQPNSPGTAAVPGPAGRINRKRAAADAAGQPAPPDAARPAQEDRTAAVPVGLPAPAQRQPAQLAGQAIQSAVPPALAQPEEADEPAVPLEPAVPVVPALLPEGEALKQCAACGAERGEGDRKLRKCSGCMAVRFCSLACAKQHWPAHKQLCKELQRQRREAEQH